MIAWHYTTGERAAHILASGLIMPAKAFIGPHERPVAWFSLHEKFEPTAVKMIRDAQGAQRRATMEELAEHGVGLFRFGVETPALLRGEFLRRAARISRATWAGLCSAGRGQGADPNHWYGHIGPISIAGMLIEHMPAVHSAWARHVPAAEAA